VVGAATAWLLRPGEPRVTATRTLVRTGVTGLETDGTTVYYSDEGRLMAVPLSGGEPRDVVLPWRDATGVVLAGRRPEPTALLLLRGSEAWELVVSGGGPTRLEGLPPLADAEWSPRGDRLAWVETRDDREILWVGDARGRGPRKLAEAPKEGRGGRSLWLTGWDPSGERIRYVPRGAKRFLDASASSGDSRDAGVEEQSDLWGTGSWTADGAFFLHGSARGVMGFPDRPWPRAPRRTVSLGGPTHAWTIRATPDGGRLVGAIDRPGAEIVRVEPGRGTITPLLGRGPAGVLDFSPDGTRVAWAGNEGGLWVGRPDGTDRRPLGDRQPAHQFPIRWSPDGRWIAFSASEGVDVVDLEPRLFLASVTEGTVEPLTADDPGRIQGDPCWSPDGRSVAYGPSPVNGLPPEEEIYLRRVDLATRRVEKIEGSEGLWAPKCARDGRILATDELRARRAGNPGPGSPAPVLFYKIRDSATGKWTPLEVDMGPQGGGALFYPTWSRDGRTLFAYQFPHRHVVRIDPRTGRLEPVADVTGLGETSVWLDLDPTDAPLVHRDASVREIVVMDLEWN
jgi:Tol biopolymer transport system component